MVDLKNQSIPEHNDVVVIGAGLGGLSCALDLARQGYRVCVIEQHTQPGGYAHAFKRKGYSFDVSLHYFGGLWPGTMIHTVFDRYGVVDKLTHARPEILYSAEYPGMAVKLPNAREELVEHLGRLFPHEAHSIERFFKHFRMLKDHITEPWLDPDFAVPLQERLSARYGNRTFGDLLREFVSDQRLIALLSQHWMYLGLPPDRATATFATCVSGSALLDGAGRITGGGKAITEAMIERLVELGGACVVGTPVECIVVEQNRVRGVEIGGGDFIGAATVVSNANPHETFFNLLGEDDLSGIFKHRVGRMKTSLSVYSMYFGLDCLPSDIGIVDESFMVNQQFDHEVAFTRAVQGDLERTNWCLANYQFAEPGQAASGRGTFAVVELTPAGNWLTLSEADYRRQKRAVEERLLKKYAARFPKLNEHTVVREFATPRTMARYTRNHQGAIYGFDQIPEQAAGKRLGNRTPITGLYLTGAWTQAGGGYEGAIMSGLQTSMAINRQIEPSNRAPATRTEPTDSPAPRPSHHHLRFSVPVRVSNGELNGRGALDVTAALRFMDRGRVEAIEALCEQARHPSWLTQYTVNVYRVELDCVGEARFGDALQVNTGVRKSSSHRATFDQQLINQGTDECIANASIEVLFLDEHKRLVPVPSIVHSVDFSFERQNEAPLPPVPFGDEGHFAVELPQRVYYEDTDAQGITYHVSYLRFCHRALIDVFDRIGRRTGQTVASVARDLRLTGLDIRYLNATSLGDILCVRTGARKKSARAIAIDHRIVAKTTDKIVADMMIELELDGTADSSTQVIDRIVGECSRTLR